jgi:hypothetical protein
MILALYGFLVVISLVLIIIGLLRPDETAQALIGFSFLFILSMIMVSGNLQYETGANVTTSFSYDSSSNTNSTFQVINYNQTNFNDSTAHFIGYWLAIISFLGFLGTILSMRTYKKAVANSAI